ncbi:hypothetical protein H4R18_005303 [Coemansia javaensis]|uniref:Uncharacterized protein n=1 Tax=Coemansia javaensis TaxID=2761396 RepID=A0A9W8LFK8_9FUNG|nr:hypothetical protein H4R18_005303 [Coemansia javaensis]
MASSTSDRDKKRLLCLDTESSICLSFDQSLYGDFLAMPPPFGDHTADGAPGAAGHAREQPASSGSHLVPRIQEVHGSSDSQLQISGIDLAAKLGGDKAGPAVEDAHSVSTNDASMTTAKMDLSEDTRGAESVDADLQAAIDMMLEGDGGRTLLPHDSFMLGGRSLQMAHDLACAEGAGSSKATLGRKIVQRGRDIGTRVAERLSRRSSNGAGLAAAAAAADRAKRGAPGSPYDSGANDLKDRCVECVHAAQSGAAPTRLARVFAPVVRYMQRRPMATLGIVLGALVALLAVIIVILLVGVLPFLMRSTLQDVSFTLTSVRALAPAQVTRRALAAKTIVEDVHPQALAQIMRLADEQDAEPQDGDALHSRYQRLIALNKRDATRSPPPPSSPDEDGATISAPTHASVHAATGAHPNSVPTHTPSSMSTMRAEALSAASASPSEALSGALEPTPAAAAAAIDGPAHKVSYTMQVAGSLTSGGPIGINIEFTEPLRMYWRDVEVGVVERPEGIRVSGRGTSDWSWAPFQVSAMGARLGPPEDAHAGGSAHRRDGVSQPAGLADWFAAIREHGSFTMQWRSRVRVSAMGLRASDVPFEKTVHVACLSSEECSVEM